MKKILFSIVIPTYNGEKTIGVLLKGLVKSLDDYSTEVIIIDSSSTDRTVEEIKKFKSRLKNLEIVTINNCEFGHGRTRNLAVKKARGKYVCFLTQDVKIDSKDFKSRFLEDFNTNERVVAVFGRQIPYDTTPYIQKLGILIMFWKLDKYTNKKGLLIFDKKKPFLSFSEKNEFLWYSIFDPFACYIRDFLINNPFKDVSYGEDLLIGKDIINKGFIKIYDNRCRVVHSHHYNIWDYYSREKLDIIQRKSLVKLRESTNIHEKMSMILETKDSIFQKTPKLALLIFYYAIKASILIELGLKDCFGFLLDRVK